MKTKKRNPFKVPKGYFNSLEKSLLKKTQISLKPGINAPLYDFLMEIFPGQRPMYLKSYLASQGILEQFQVWL